MKEGGAAEREETTKSKVLRWGVHSMRGNITEPDLGRTRNVECEAGRFAVRTQGFDRAVGTAAMTEKGLGLQQLS